MSELIEHVKIGDSLHILPHMVLNQLTSRRCVSGVNLLVMFTYRTVIICVVELASGI